MFFNCYPYLEEIWQILSNKYKFWSTKSTVTWITTVKVPKLHPPPPPPPPPVHHHHLSGLVNIFGLKKLGCLLSAKFPPWVFSLVAQGIFRDDGGFSAQGMPWKKKRVVIGDYTTQLYGVYKKPWQESLWNNQDSMESIRGFFIRFSIETWNLDSLWVGIHKMMWIPWSSETRSSKQGVFFCFKL